MNQTSEGKLIQEAQKRLGLSSRKAAEAANISDTRWRNITNGYQAIGQGNTIPIIAPADTLARMARVVGVTAEELTEAGRPDAGDILTELWPGERAGWTPHTDTGILPAVNAPRPAGRGLNALIERNRAGRTIASLSDACGGDPTPRRLQQIIADGIKAFPETNTITGLARGLGVAVSDVVLACAASLGLDVDDTTSNALVLAGAADLPPSSRAILQDMSRELLTWQSRSQHAHAGGEHPEAV
jgi:transcriptional regulator with XRE-family HTH domain